MKSRMSTRNNRRDLWLRRDVTLDVKKAWNQLHDFHGSDSELVSLPNPDPNMFQDAEEFRVAYWRSEAWSKFPFDVGIDRRNVALATFYDAEERCARANERLCDVLNKPIPERYRNYIKHAQSLMAHLFKDFTLDEVIEHCSWGPGATTSLPRAQASPSNKWVLAAHITQTALPYYDAFQRWSGRNFRFPTIVEGNKVVTVPKNAKTDRTIAIEPDWNMFFQLGFGSMIRRRLSHRFGLLRPHAQQVNQVLARKGSESGDLATLDLKGASDSVSLALVELLVPSDVLQHLLNLRSRKGSVDGKVITYEKISSMGNGFTFELETAIFYCLVRASSGHAVVFGDDIIVNATTASHVVEFLDFMGFTVNEKKSFSTGPFRESCGGHFFSGVNVTPPYFRKAIIGPTRLVYANRLSELVDNGHWRRGDYRKIWEILAAGVPRKLFGPTTVPGTLHVSFDRACPKFSRRFQTLTGTRILDREVPRLADANGGLLQSLWAPPKDITWRFSSSEQSGRRTIGYGKWVSHWQGPSPWS